MLNGCEITRPCALDPEHAVSSAAAALARLGYEIKEHRGWHAELKIPGKLRSPRFLDYAHHVLVDGQPGTLRFRFTTGAVASSVSDDDRKELEARVDHVIGVLLGEPTRVGAEDVEVKPAVRPAQPEIGERLARIDSLCVELLSKVEAGPEILREFVSQPAVTVRSVRATCHELARRESELREMVGGDERLLKERTGLAERIERETDLVVRQRLGAALAALDDQLRQRQELATAATRLEAESTRILYTLESLITQVLRVESADSASADVTGAAVRQSLEHLGLEVGAVAEALEAVHCEQVSPVVAVSLEAERAPAAIELRPSAYKKEP